MKASELIKLIQTKIDIYWDEEIRVKESYEDYGKQIERIFHKGEDWIYIIIE